MKKKQTDEFVSCLYFLHISRSVILSHQRFSKRCSSCGAPSKPGAKGCEYCRSVFVVTSDDSPDMSEELRITFYSRNENAPDKILANYSGSVNDAFERLKAMKPDTGIIFDLVRENDPLVQLRRTPRGWIARRRNPDSKKSAYVSSNMTTVAVGTMMVAIAKYENWEACAPWHLEPLRK